jgi:hypothetical protein
MASKRRGLDREGERLPLRRYDHGSPIRSRAQVALPAGEAGPTRRTKRAPTPRPLKTERERSGVGRAGYRPQSRSYESNVRRSLRKNERVEDPSVRRKARLFPNTKDASRREMDPFDEAHVIARRVERGTKGGRSSVYSRKAAYDPSSRGGVGGFREGTYGQTMRETRRGGAGNQDRISQRQANVKNKQEGLPPGRKMQGQQGAQGQRGAPRSSQRGTRPGIRGKRGYSRRRA